MSKTGSALSLSSLLISPHLRVALSLLIHSLCARSPNPRRQHAHTKIQTFFWESFFELLKFIIVPSRQETSYNCFFFFFFHEHKLSDIVEAFSAAVHGLHCSSIAHEMLFCQYFGLKWEHEGRFFQYFCVYLNTTLKDIVQFSGKHIVCIGVRCA